MRLCVIPAVLLLAACVGPKAPPASSASAVVRSAEVGADATANTATRPTLDALPGALVAGLPARTRELTPLRAQPLQQTGVLRQIPADTELRVLGEMANAEGQWLSVLVGDVVGWVPAAQVERQP